MENTSQTTENKNLEYLKNSLSYGFGDHLHKALEENMGRQRDKFTLSLTGKFENEQVRYDLNFSASDKGMYYWNTTKATLQSPDPAKNGRSHTFYAGRNSPHPRQMHKLLTGASVYRSKLEKQDKSVYPAWQKILFNAEVDKYGNHPLKSYGEQNGSRIDGALAKHNDTIKFKDNEQRANAIEKWKKGEPVIHSMDIKGTMERVVIFFDSQFKDLNIIDKNGELIRTSKGLDVVSVNTVEPSTAQDDSAKVTFTSEATGMQQSSVDTKASGQTAPAPSTDKPQEQEKKKNNPVNGLSAQTELAAKDLAQNGNGHKQTEETKNGKAIGVKEAMTEDRQKSEKRGMRHGR